ncbi:MAG TPA: GerMN domain-containing protein [Clostridia bacterium]|nr:GerMN domain-containing protein [Clostridia bacterium]
MRRSVLSIFLFTMILFLSACSLPGINNPEGTASENTLRNGTPAENTDEVKQGDTSAVDEETSQSSAVNSKTVKVTLYFPKEDNSGLKTEERDIQVVDGAILKACILALGEGPKTEGLRNPIPEGTKLLGISVHDKVATVDFSNEFQKTNGLSEITTRFSVVNSLTGISGIEKVRIHINGEEMIGESGMPLGEIGPVTLDENGMPVAGEMKTVTLYFSDSNAEYIVGEKRDIAVEDGDTVEEAVLRELFKGPLTENLWDAIPDGTKLLSVSTRDGLCTVNFSREYVDNSPGGTASERMAIMTVVDTLTGLDGIKKVQFLIEGKKREIYTHAIFDKPFSRDEAIIAK